MGWGFRRRRGLLGGLVPLIGLIALIWRIPRRARRAVPPSKLPDKYEKALAALPQNEPINWLLGSVLRKFAERKAWHFLFDTLATNNPLILEPWNSWIAEFRSVLRNPDVAAQKATDELSNGPATRIGDFMAEVLAVINLSRLGYTHFEVVLAGGNRKAVDFMAQHKGRRARIEVKNLHESEDIIRTVVSKHLEKCRQKHPDRFDFTLSVNHYHHGTLSDGAIARVKNAIDQLPKIARDEYPVTLDGEIRVVLKRIKVDPGQRTGLVIQSGFRSDDFEFDLPELQGLFVKTLRVVSQSIEKFFGRQADPEAINVITFQWLPPKVMYDPNTLETVQRAIEEAFAAVGLQFKVLIFEHVPSHNFRLNVNSQQLPKA